MTPQLVAVHFLNQYFSCYPKSKQGLYENGFAIDFLIKQENKIVVYDHTIFEASVEKIITLLKQLIDHEQGNDVDYLYFALCYALRCDELRYKSGYITYLKKELSHVTKINDSFEEQILNTQDFIVNSQLKHLETEARLKLALEEIEWLHSKLQVCQKKEIDEVKVMNQDIKP